MSMSPKFCNNEVWNERLSDLMHKSVFPNFTQDVYSIFKSVYEGNSYRNHEKFIFNISHNNLKHFSYYFSKERDLEQIEYVGIDFPVYFNFQENSKKILIVGIDPLRSRCGECNGCKSNHQCYLKRNISLGTPYGFHGMTEKNREKSRYWNFIKCLCENKCTVCLSDTFKLYFLQKEGKRIRKSNSIEAFKHPEWNGGADVHQMTFQKEVEIFNPDLIVTLGRIPQLWFTGVGNKEFKELLIMPNLCYSINKRKIPVLSLIHLSGLATSYAVKLYGGPQKKLGYTYANLVITRLLNNK